MGGIGSNRWGSRKPIRTVEGVRELGISDLNKGGFLKPGSKGTITYDKKYFYEIDYAAHDGYLTLGYFLFDRENDREWTDEDTVQLEYTACNYGGGRPWFLCPGCDSRVAILYQHKYRYRCRSCCGLKYKSQNEQFDSRMFRKSRKIVKQIGANINFMAGTWERPKGMHRATFRREYLRAQKVFIMALEATTASMAPAFKKLEKTMGAAKWKG